MYLDGTGSGVEGGATDVSPPAWVSDLYNIIVYIDRYILLATRTFETHVLILYISNILLLMYKYR